MRFSKADHSLGTGIDAVDFAACPDILPRRVWQRASANCDHSVQRINLFLQRKNPQVIECQFRGYIVSTARKSKQQSAGRNVETC